MSVTEKAAHHLPRWPAALVPDSGPAETWRLTSVAIKSTAKKAKGKCGTEVAQAREAGDRDLGRESGERRSRSRNRSMRLVWRVGLAMAGVIAAVGFFAVGWLRMCRSRNSPRLHQPLAGAHPDVETHVTLDSNIGLNGPPSHQKNSPCDCEDVKDLNVSLPTGFVGNPHSTPNALPHCSPNSTVRLILRVGSSRFARSFSSSSRFTICASAGRGGSARIQHSLLSTAQFTVISPRTDSDYGLNVLAPSLSHFIPPGDILQDLWGVPAAASHDELRYVPDRSITSWKMPERCATQKETRAASPIPPRS